MVVCKSNMLYTLNLYNALGQLYLSKTGRGKKVSRWEKNWLTDSFTHPPLHLLLLKLCEMLGGEYNY